MDAELRELERLFQAAQQAKPSARLSERNVVELVAKLQELGLLDSDLLHTVSGREYITQDRLRHEMEDEIKSRKRVSLVEMATSIGVDYFHCERQAEQIKESNSWTMLEQGEVFTTSYWDSLAEEVNETLKEASHVSLGELATRFNVGVELLTGMLASRIGTLVHAKLEGGQLYTEAYVARVKGMVRGAIRALTVPTTLQSVWSYLQSQLRHKDDMGVTGELSLFLTVLNELVSEGSVKGTLRGGGTTWTPAVFAQSQRQSVEAFYSQNSYISYDALKKLNIPQPKQYLQSKYSDGFALETVFIHSSFISLLDTAADEAIKGVGWFDALEVVPTAFGTADSSKLLLLCPSVRQGLKEAAIIHIAETCLVSTGFVKALRERLQDDLREAQGKNADAKLNSRKGQTEPEPAQGKGSKATERKQKLDMDDDENVVKGKTKKRGGKVRSSKSATAKGASFNGAKEEDNEVPSEEKLAEKIIEWFPDIEAAGTDDGFTGVLAKSLAVQLRPPLLSYMASLRRAYLGAQAEERRKRTEALQIKITEEYAKLQLFSKALEMFDDDKGMEGVLEKHLLRTYAADIADVYLEAQVLLENAESCGPLPLKPFTATVRIALAKSLPGTLSSTACEMVETLEGKNIAAFELAFELMVKESGLRVKRLDKKSERTLFHAYRKNLAEQVESEQDPIALLPKVVALLYAQHHGRALQTPGRAISTAVSRLERQVPKDAFRALEEYHGATVACLSGSEDMKQVKRELLLQRMEDLRAITHAAEDETA